jgi:hypothetical protein
VAEIGWRENYLLERNVINMKDNDDNNYLIIIAFFSFILFALLSIASGGSQDISRDSLLSILTVSYIVNNLPSKKK